MHRRLVLLTFSALLVCAALLAACGGDDAATSTPTAAATASPTPTPDVNAAVAAKFIKDLARGYNAGDYQGFVDSFDDKGIREFNGDDPARPADEVRAEVRQNASGGSTVTAISFSNSSTTGDTTTITFNSTNGGLYRREIFTLKKTDSTFIIDGYESVSPDVPAGVPALTVEATEYQFILDETKIIAGQRAFAFSNIGSQYHELRFLKVDATTPVQQIVDDALAVTDPSQLPADIEADVGSGSAPPGQMYNVIFVNPLESGRYLMVCFVPDQADEQPHLAHGMFHEFTIR